MFRSSKKIQQPEEAPGDIGGGILGIQPNMVASGYKKKKKGMNDPSLDPDADSGSDLDDSGGSSGLDDAEDVSNHDHKDQDDDGEPVSAIARKETKAVCYLRIILFSILCSIMVLFAVGVFLYLQNDEQDEFEEGFRDYAAKVGQAFQANGRHRLQALGNFATTIVSHAQYSSAMNNRSSDETWPTVAIPNYERRAAALRSLADSFLLFYIPYVQPEDKERWEEFSVQSRGWINESLVERYGAALPSDPLNPPMDPISEEAASKGITLVDWSLDEYKMAPQLYRFYEKWYVNEFGPGPYCPLYQVAPVIPNVVNGLTNYNLCTHSSLRKGFEAVVRTKEAALTEVMNVGTDINDREQYATAFTFEVFVGQGQDTSTVEYQGDPFSTILYPVLETLANGTSVVRGFFIMDIYWRAYLMDILPPQASGVVCVLDSSDCGHVSTYEIWGRDAKFLGVGDLHDESYSERGLVYEVDFSSRDVAGAMNNTAATSSASVPITNEVCHYKLSIYPSRTLEESYETSRPLQVTLCVVFIFVFTTLVFVSYDWIVEKRQKKVMRTAERTNEVVSSLFPKVVRDRMYAENEAAKRKKDNRNGFFNQQMDDPREGGNNPNGGSAGDSVSPFMDPASGLISDESPPIAELYPSATVLFADLAGFTAWSSSREPVQVFTLLETLYRAFDLIARKRGVFKIETIGDCYVAVTGLPTPMPRHAVVMARFAQDCLSRMYELLPALADRLGPDTLQLALRVGLHSGPVTAGVLRGEKARFQLFGDTVNTAARMESNGIKGRIHVSQSTADLLSEAGKSNWLSTREDKIVAKGKGQMQTFWVNVAGNSCSTASPSVLGMDIEENNMSQDELVVGALGRGEPDEDTEENNEPVVGSQAREKMRSIEASVRDQKFIEVDA